MRIKDLIFAKMKGEQTHRVPWIPFAGIHAGKLINTPANLLYRDEAKLYEALLKVNELYKPDGQPIMFDLQIEAEILGCELKWAEKTPPAVLSHPWSKLSSIPSFEFQKNMGRLPLLFNTTAKMKAKVGDNTAIFGLITGPLTLASHLRGTALYLDILRNKNFAGKILEACTEIAYKMVNYYIEVGADIIAIVDPVVSQISPKSFTELMSSLLTQIFKYIQDKNRWASFFICGDATKLISEICKTHPNALFVDENVNLKLAQAITNQYNLALGGNIPLTTVMLYGNQQDNMKYVIDMIGELTTDRLILAPGCDMPYDVPIENVIGIAEAVAHPKEIAQSLQHYFQPPLNIDIALPDYKNLEKPLIELFTIDSDQCPACHYMKTVAIKAVEYFQDRIDFIEYKWIDLHNIARTKKMGITHLPCIYIDGELKWSSLIPQEDEYFSEIERALKKRAHFFNNRKLKE